MPRKIFAKIILVLSLLIVPAIDGYCQAPNIWDPALKEAQDKLRPWFKDVQQRIQKQAKFGEFNKALGNKRISCAFSLGEHGEPKYLEVFMPCGDASLDQEAMELVDKAGPFKKPPNDYPYQRGIAINFQGGFGSSVNPTVQLVSIDTGCMRTSGQTRLKYWKVKDASGK